MPNFENHPLYPDNSVPLFIAAGIFRYPVQLEPFTRVKSPGAVPALTMGSFSYHANKGSATMGDDFVYYPDRKMAGNARRFPNPGRNGMIELKESVRILSAIGIKTIVSVTSLPHEIPADVIPELVDIAVNEVGPTAVEINLSCPTGENADGTPYAPISESVDMSREVLEKSRIKVGFDDVTLGIKDSPHVASVEDEIDYRQVKELAQSVRNLINFATGINSIGYQHFPEITYTGGKGGMSGPVVAKVAKNHLKLWREYAPDVPYLSCGGVELDNAAQEVPERLELGAMRVGGAQEFIRARHPITLAAAWGVEVG